MLSSEIQRKIHQLENELLVIEEEKRHILQALTKLEQEARIYKHTFEIAQKNLDINKTETSKSKERLAQLEQEIHQLRIQIKTQHD